jgi:hypothetical protein
MTLDQKTGRCFLASVLVFATASVTGCGDSDNGNPVGGGTPGSSQGVFLDSAVEGLTFAGGGETGETDAQGMFTYRSGSSVEFSVGGIVIGSGQPFAIMTPVEVVPGATNELDDTVTNIARFLQTVDDDDDLSNGIAITQAVRNAAAGRSIDFGQAASTFDTDPNVQSVVSDLTSETTAGMRALVSIQDARDHLNTTLLASYDGSYQGTYSLDQDPNSAVGTWHITVAPGAVGCTFSQSGSTTVSSFILNGTMTLPGILDVATPGGAFIYGTIARDGSVTGRWYGPPPPGLSDSGEFKGSKM